MYAYYRIYDLLWTPDKEQEDKFRRLLLIIVGLFLFFSVLMPWLPTAEIDKDEVPGDSETLCEAGFGKETAATSASTRCTAGTGTHSRTGGGSGTGTRRPDPES